MFLNMNHGKLPLMCVTKQINKIYTHTLQLASREQAAAY